MSRSLKNIKPVILESAGFEDLMSCALEAKTHEILNAFGVKDDGCFNRFSSVGLTLKVHYKEKK